MEINDHNPKIKSLIHEIIACIQGCFGRNIMKKFLLMSNKKGPIFKTDPSLNFLKLINQCFQ